MHVPGLRGHVAFLMPYAYVFAALCTKIREAFGTTVKPLAHPRHRIDVCIDTYMHIHMYLCV